jgi:ABC-type Na+ efflux pump permease subunit
MIKLFDVVRSMPILSRNFKQLFKERTFMLLVLLLLFVVLTASILVSILIVIFNPQFLVTDDIAVGVLVNDSLPRELLDVRQFDFIAYDSKEDAQFAFDVGNVSALIFVQTARQNYSDPIVLDMIITDEPLKQSLFLSLSKPALQKAEDRYQEQRGAVSGSIWSSQVLFNRPPLNGLHIMYEAIVGMMIPFLLLIPIFLIGNLFIDSVSQEFEEGNMQILFTSVSPLRYIHEHILQAILLNGVLLSLFLGLLALRFSFLENFASIFLYNTLFLIPVVIFALLLVFIFKKKETAQLSYTFAVLAIFVISPFVSFGPTFVLTEYLVGNTAFHIFGVLFALILGLLSYTWLYIYVKREYYV